MQATTEGINQVIQTVAAAQQSSATQEQRRQAVEVSDQVWRCEKPATCYHYAIHPASAKPCLTGGPYERLDAEHLFGLLQLKRGDARNSIQVALQLVQSGQQVEVQHFGYTILQHVVGHSSCACICMST